MSILAPPPFRPVLYTTHHNANTGTGNGTSATCAGYGMALLEVTISATAEIFLYGLASSGGQTRFVRILDSNGHELTSITASGNYRVDVAGLHSFLAAITSNTGSVTVKSTMLPITMAPESVSLRRRNTLIASNAALTLAAGASASGTGIFAANSGIIDIRDYAFVYYAVNGAVVHTTGWKLEQLRTWHDNTGPTLNEYETIMSTTARRDTSEWQEARSPGIFLKLTNQDAVERTYKLYVFGIR